MACSSSEPDNSTPAAESASTVAQADPTATVAAIVEESLNGLEPGVQVFDIDHGGLSRRFLVEVPDGFRTDQAYPVVFAFHFLGGTAESYRDVLDGVAQAKGHIGVFPQGVDNSWNICLEAGAAGRWSGTCGSGGVPSAADDAGFADAVLDWLSSRATIDTDRVYALGFSNGGVFIHRLALESDRFVAVVAMAGSFHEGQAIPAEVSPVSVMQLHGERDTAVPFDGGRGFSGIDFQPARATITAWAAHNGCTTSPTTESLADGETAYRHTGCAGGREVVLYALRDAGHGIPLATGGNLWDLIWDFFERNAR